MTMKHTTRQDDRQRSTADRSHRTLRQIQKADAKPKPEPKARVFNFIGVVRTNALSERELAEAKQQLRKIRPDHFL